MARGQTTTDHEAIRKWVEERGGHPARVRQSGDDRDPGILRIDYPGYAGDESLEAISWNEFFEKFEAERLAFVYQDKTATGEPSRFSKLVRRHGAGRSTRRAAGTATRGTPSAARSGRRSRTAAAGSDGAEGDQQNESEEATARTRGDGSDEGNQE